MRGYIILLIFLCYVTSCTNKDAIPSDVLPRTKMEKVMWDMLQADRFSAQFLVRDSARQNVDTARFKLYETVFAIHDISKEEFLHSMKFYLDRPDLTKVMFDSMAAEANRKKPELYQPAE